MATDHKRRATDLLPQSEVQAAATERRSPYFEMRRYISIGGMFGNFVFLFSGSFVGFFYGGLGGTRYFEELFLIKEAGSIAAITGSIVGVLMGLICVWAITVITFAMAGAMIYWVRYRTFPPPPP